MHKKINLRTSPLIDPNQLRTLVHAWCRSNVTDGTNTSNRNGIESIITASVVNMTS